MGWLTGDVVAVTGGGSGLGRAICERLVEEGARVVVLERSEERVASLRSDFPATQLLAEVGDVTRYVDNERLVAAALAHFGQLDCYIGNAGLFDFHHQLEELRPEGIAEAFRALFDVNVLGALLGARAAVGALRESQGSMIFTLSHAVSRPGGGGPLYTASKHALVGLVRQLAYELAPGVRVNGVAPGGMVSDLRGPAEFGADRSLADELAPELLQALSPLDLAPEPQDFVAPYVLLAARQASRVISGTILDVHATHAAGRAYRQGVMGQDRGPAHEGQPPSKPS